MSDGYPVALIRADGDDVSAWLARRGIPAEVVAGPEGWVSVEGLTPEDLAALDELVAALKTTAIVLSADGGELVVDVLGTDAAIDAAPDDAHALAAVARRPDAAGRVADVLGDTGLGLRERHRRLAELLGLPSRLPAEGAARAAATGAPLEPAGPAGPGRDTAATQTGGAVFLPSWLSTIVLWTGVVTMLLAVVLAFRADHSRGVMAAGLCGLAGAACVVLGFAGRVTRR
jgi:hypothetical protein